MNLKILLIVIGLLLPPCVAFAQSSEPSWPGRVKAVRSDWNAPSPPDIGWVEVTLPDDWSRRWPGFDGVVWYRLTWDEPAAPADRGVLIDYFNMAGEIEVNDIVLARDASLVEPLTRSWNTPRFFRLSSPLLHAGHNALLIRVSGVAAYQPGLGRVSLGDPARMHALYERVLFQHRDAQIIAYAIIATLGGFFLALWLFRRKETAYGWFAAMQLAWLAVSWNQFATSIWPFPNTDLFEAANTAALLGYCLFYTLFVLRICERSWPRREAALWLAAAAGSLWLLLVPHADIGTARAALTTLAAIYIFVPNGILLYSGIRSVRPDLRILGIVGILNMAAGVHDTLVFTGMLGGNNYYASLSAVVTAVGGALVLAWSFARNLHRIEGFNLELQQNIEDARTELGGSLLRQHELELVQARLGERMNLAHDLHDGLGGMLIGNIAALERAPESVPSQKMLDAMRQLRDDLRLIIDAASSQHYGEYSLKELLGPLRHRMSQLFETHDIAIRWRVENLEDVLLTSTQSMDLLRILQEALTNVVKHSGATRVEVDLVNDASGLRLIVSDNGRGLPDQDNAIPGTGMRSMRARAQRLDAELRVHSNDGSTIVSLFRPWPEADQLLLSSV
ncbi:MAG TPA: ATP-binding protein [Rudaea sp.]|nr:ATP-binding protein [Rudaea sp.]